MRPARTRYRFPPGPKGRPLIGNLLEFRRDPTGFCLRLAQNYGDAAHFMFGRRHAVQLNNPDMIHDVLVTHHTQFRKTHALDSAEMVLGNGLVRSEGEVHRRQRRLIQPAFQQDRMANYAPAIVHSAIAASDRWRAGETVDMFEEMLRLTVAVAARTLFSSSVEADFEQVGRDLTTAFEYFYELASPLARLYSKLPTAGRRRFLAARQRLDRLIYRILRDRRVSGQQVGDLLGVLLSAQDHEGDGLGMSDSQVRDEAMTMFVASHETTATAMTWVWYSLAKHPAIQRRLQDELREVLDGRVPSYSDIKRLTYTRMVIAESMRVYPPVWAITRRAVVDYAFGPWLVPAGTTIGMSQYVMHRDPRYYPEPDRFDPNRWTDAEIAKRPRYSYFPFGGGPRLCIGEKFAWMEATLILACLCQSWEAHLAPGHQIRLRPLIALRPDGGMPIRLERRPALQRIEHWADPTEREAATAITAASPK